MDRWRCVKGVEKQLRCYKFSTLVAEQINAIGLHREVGFS